MIQAEARVYRFGQLMAFILAVMTLACLRPPSRSVNVSANHRENRFELLSSPPDEAVLAASLADLRLEPENPDYHRQAGMIYLIISKPDRWDYVELAIDHLQQASAAYPDDPQTLIYLGLSRAARAKNPKTPILEKLSNAKKGFSFMDEALFLDPENPSLRLLRAKAQLLAPPLLGRKQLLLEDTQWLTQLADSKESASLPGHLRVLVHIYLGDYQYRVLNDPDAARSHWEKAVAIDSPYGAEARDRLTGKLSSF